MVRCRLSVGWKSVAGQHHRASGRENEDAVLVTTETRPFDAVLVVADGMGGHPEPRLAAQQAAQAAYDFLTQPRRWPPQAAPPQLLEAAVAHGQNAVATLGDRARHGKAPGTTLSIAVVVGGELFVGHVGDGSVLVARGTDVARLAGGEEGRVGNRPASFLGAGAAPVPEHARWPLQRGDRILLCTDGLTRYFAGAQAGALGDILTRAGAGVEAIAAQLTAHSREAQYDDDTTVVVAEVTDWQNITEQPRTAVEPRRERGGSSWLAGLAGAALGGLLVAGGFWIGQRGQAPTAGSNAANGTAPNEGEPVPPEAVKGLPEGNLVLLDETGRRLYVLRTRPPAAPTAEGPADLRAFRVDGQGRLTSAGRFRLDAGRGRLSDPAGRQFAVTVDAAAGEVRILRSGMLSVASQPPGAAVRIDGRTAGPTPLKTRVAAGRRQVRVEGKGWSAEHTVDVAPDRTTTISVGNSP